MNSTALTVDNDDLSTPRVLDAPGRPRSLTVSATTLRDFLLLPPPRRRCADYDLTLSAPFHITARHRGEAMFSNWFQDASPFRAIEKVVSSIPVADLLELWTTVETKPVEQKKWEKVLVNRKSGRVGAQVTFNGSVARVSPLRTIATNQPLRDWFLAFLKDRRMEPGAFFSCGGRLDLLIGHQYLIETSPNPFAVETFRGNTVVDPTVSPKLLAKDIVNGMTKWLMANFSSGGALPYKYWPSTGRYSTADNPIRRFMATVALNRLGDAMENREIKTAAKQNLEFNLSRFFRSEDDMGLIEWDGSVKLGAVALAALAILESPVGERWAAQYAKLCRTVDRLWQADGSFRTFYFPFERNDNQNFYPGEALLLWATVLQRGMDSALLDRTLKSIVYYREHFRRRPNPAFVPWHTQAVSAIFQITGRSDLREYVYEMNDWLLPHQQWGGKLDADLWGRFYSPSKPDYGPPHASSTGVYMEGLVDALILARAGGDQTRAVSYETAILRAIRSIAQLQFKDRTDAFYVSHRQRVMGGIRTEVYNNEIRIDNVQHALMALLKYSDVDKHVQAMRHSLDCNDERRATTLAIPACATA